MTSKMCLVHNHYYYHQIRISIYEEKCLHGLQSNNDNIMKKQWNKCEFRNDQSLSGHQSTAFEGAFNLETFCSQGVTKME